MRAAGATTTGIDVASAGAATDTTWSNAPTIWLQKQGPDCGMWWVCAPWCPCAAIASLHART
jgi:hypothetical protein